MTAVQAPPILRRRGAGFADFTVTQRFPKIAASVSSVLDDHRDAQRAIDALVKDVVAGAPIDSASLRRPTPFWERYLSERQSATWFELPFFDVEFLFYHALNSIAGYFERGIDVFRDARREARLEALAGLPSLPMRAWEAAGQPGSDDIAAALRLALLGNEADYSQLTVSHSQPSPWNERIVVDERDALLARLSRRAQGDGTIHLITDNAGPELLADLLLADTLLRFGSTTSLVVHCKPWPMFVSDALPEDVERSVEQLRSHSNEVGRIVGQRLQQALAGGRLRIQSHAGWGEPRHFDALDADLSAALCAASVVIAKGDLNYRRFVGDRDWPIGTPTAVGSGAVPFTAFALRVLKSEALVGIAPEVAARAAATSPSWRTDGSHALVQLVGGTG